MCKIRLVTALENKLDLSFSNVKYRDVALIGVLAQQKEGSEIRTYIMVRTQLPHEVYRQILMELDAFSLQYGLTSQHGKRGCQVKVHISSKFFCCFSLSARSSLLMVIFTRYSNFTRGPPLRDMYDNPETLLRRWLRRYNLTVGPGRGLQ